MVPPSPLPPSPPHSHKHKRKHNLHNLRPKRPVGALAVSGLLDYSTFLEMKRQQESGAEKRKKRKQRDDARASLAGSMLKYVQAGARGQEEDTDEEEPSTSSPNQPQPASRSVHPATVLSPDQPPSTTTDTQQITTTSESPVTESPSEGDKVETGLPSPTDPALWPLRILDADRVEIVRRGPFRVPSDFNFPKGLDGRAFHSSLHFKTLSNGEKVKRSWLVYSKQNNAAFCFACKLFSLKAIKLTAEGNGDWSNINNNLISHECSSDHAQCMFKWRELDTRLQTNTTIDYQEQTLLEAEKRRWRDVLKRLLKITLSLASRNLSFRGSSQCLYEPDNGNFLKEVELLGSFDPVMENHLTKITDFSRVHGMSKENLQKNCIEVQKTLTEKGNSDIDGLEMVQEIINLPQLPPQTTALELLSFLHENRLQEVYPNLWVALRIALTLPVTVASAERSFSKLKLIKTYLRSTMGQERLSGLAVISINGEVAQRLSYDDLINDFAARKCRRVPVFIEKCLIVKE
ncbi:uncharacterized protein LOC134874557 [Eleginops maclovinus]|uniref:uncharacterized protein LOC134874557 n=1 Tax=Eleginops maclovinus TaxID=56733 RepID=UPI0030802DCC